MSDQTPQEINELVKRMYADYARDQLSKFQEDLAFVEKEHHKRLDSINAEIASAKTTLAETTQAYLNLQDLIASSKKQIDKSRTLAQVELSKIKNELTSAQSSLKEVRSSLSLLSREKETFIAEIQTKQQFKESLIKQINDAESRLRSAVAQKNDAEEKLVAAKQRAEHTLAVLNQTATDVSKDISEKLMTQKMLEKSVNDLLSQIALLNKTVDETTTFLDEKRRLIELQKDMSAELARKRATLDQIERQLSERRTIIEGQEEQIRVKTKRLQEKEQALQALQIKIEGGK
jgi:chromosome segregation ATPase